MIRDAYAHIVDSQNLRADPAQERVVDALACLSDRVLKTRRIGWRIARATGLSRSDDDLKGLYLWGGVGRGKTFLMDLFFECLAIDKKRRVHFHRLMGEVHARLAQLRHSEDPLDVVAADIAAQTRVLCFDEFFVSDIGDAMILARLLDGLIRRDVTLVTTSNSPPSELYRNGLQRERFLPAIDLLEKHTKVMHMEGEEDYRLRLMEAAGTYLLISDSSTPDKLEQFFADLAAGRASSEREIEILGRPIPAVRCAKGIAWFGFEHLCDGPRSQQDYIEIARWYQTVILSNVPILTRKTEDAARRFIALVDEFYDRRVKLIVSAAAEAGELYQGSRLQFEFERTKSRLTEMQSRDYLHSAHLA